MSHLSPERLAALIDEQPTAGELAHLAACRACSRERGAFEALGALSGASHSIGAPLTNWDALGKALVRDGIIDGGRGFGWRASGARRWLQAAAAVILLAGGAVLGRMTAPAGTPVIVGGTLIPEQARFASVEEAREAAARSQSVYQASMAFIAAQDENTLSLATPAVIKTRLAALDQVTQIAGAALEEAPYDSVINTLYLNAQGQREASIRMLNTSSMRVTTY